MKKHITNRSNRKRSQTHGFLRRTSTRNGRKTLTRRRQKGRWKLIPA